MEGSDSEEDLPPIFEWRSQNKEVTPNKSATKYRVEDLVWIKYRRSFWPAVVCRIFPKEKKMKVMFVDSPTEENMLKVSYRRAIAYSSPKSRKMKFQAQNGCDALAEAIDRVDQFLCKRALGGNGISPCKFFKRPYFYVGNVDISESFGGMESDEDGAGGEDDDTLTDESDEDETVGEIKMKEEDDRHSDKEDDESESPVIKLNNSGNADNTITTHDDALRPGFARICEEKHRPVPDEAAKLVEAALAEKVMAAIKTDEYVTFLKKVFNEKMECKRHHVFINGTMSVRRGLKFETGFGPFVNASQQDILLKYLLQTFKLHVSPAEHFDINAYLFEVLVPEAIVWALRKILKISCIQAEAMLQGESVYLDVKAGNANPLEAKT